VARVFDPKQIEKILAGGGGTDMGIGIDAAMKLKQKPDIIIVLTDGQTPWPNRPPKAKTIIGLLGGDTDTPKWAKKIIIEKGR